MVQNRGKLMWASFLTLIVAGMGFGVRAGTLAEWAKQFGFTQVELGNITGGGLVGFGVVILCASLFIDRIGYRAVFILAFLLHVLSVIITLAATPVFAAMGRDATYWCLYWGIFIFAIANGLCESVINPLIANVYSERKTHYLNILHAGWPGGMILGGLVGYMFLGNSAQVRPLRWEIVLGLYLIPGVWYGLIALKEPFPESEVKKAGISFGQMLAEFASPVLLFLLLLHACVGYVELGTDSWITNITEAMTRSEATAAVGSGFLLFIYAAAIMFVLRFFAGPIVERTNPLGLLCLSTILGTSGLLFLSYSRTAAMAWLAVTIYGFGKTFLWPTMLGIVGERFPRGGALTMGVIGGVGMLSAGLLGTPGIGYKQDFFATKQLKQLSEPSYERYASADENGFLFFPRVRGLDGQKVGVLLDPDGPAATLQSDIARTESVPAELRDLDAWWQTTGSPNVNVDKQPVEESRIFGGRMALRLTAAVPAFMCVGYLILVLYFRAKGGYTTVEIGADGQVRDTRHRPTAEEAYENGERGPTSGQA
jgi:MFS family permease